jgi:hypothetical protein
MNIRFLHFHLFGPVPLGHLNILRFLGSKVSFVGVSGRKWVFGLGRISGDPQRDKPVRSDAIEGD